MIRHTFKIIWNERKTNAWIVLEFIVVFCILWFCCDYLYYLGSRYMEPHGYDIDHVYVIRMGEKEKQDLTEEERNAFADTFRERVMKYPGVENVFFSLSAIPYGWSTNTQGFHINGDSLSRTIQIKRVTPEFFDVFKMKLVRGRLFDGGGMESVRQVVISPARDDLFGPGIDGRKESYPVEEVKKLLSRLDDENPYTVAGVVEKQKDAYYYPYVSCMFIPLARKDVNLVDNQIAVRVNPAADRNFAARFLRDMKEQLLIGSYFLSSVVSMKDMQKKDEDREVTDNLNSVVAITAFLIVNIFLGILGTFWSRIQSRRGEIGLRIALGSSKRRVRNLLFTETFLLLFLSSMVGTVISLHVGQTELLEALGIPLADREQAGFGSGQDLINYGLTFLFLLAVSFFSVWYPARKASNIQPAEALRNE